MDVLNALRPGRLAAALALIVGAQLPGSVQALANPLDQAAGTQVELAAGQNEARFRAHEQLVGQPLPNEAVGTTRDVTGAIVLDATNTPLTELSTITVDLRALKSDEPRRDNVIQRQTLQTDLFPYATFVPRETTGLPAPLPTSGQAVFRMLGDLTVHGVTRPTDWEVTATFTELDVSGLASTRVRMTDFNMTPPQVGPVISIDDELTLEIEFQAGTTAAGMQSLDGM